MSKTWNEEELQQVSAAMKKRGLPTFEEFCKEMPIKESANRLYDVIYFDEESGDIEVKMSGYPLEECQNELRQMAVNMMVECGAHVVDALYLYTSGGVSDVYPEISISDMGVSEKHGESGDFVTSYRIVEHPRRRESSRIEIVGKLMDAVENVICEKYGKDIGLSCSVLLTGKIYDDLSHEFDDILRRNT